MIGPICPGAGVRFTADDDQGTVRRVNAGVQLDCAKSYLC